MHGNITLTTLAIHLMTINGDSLLRHFPISRRTRVFIFVIHKYNHPPPAESASIKSKCSHTDSPLSDTRAHLFHVLCRRRRRRRPQTQVYKLRLGAIRRLHYAILATTATE